jgi:hypothetical protein
LLSVCLPELGSIGNYRRDVAQLGCVAQIVVRRLAVRQARVRFPARQPMDVFPTELTSDEEMERNLGEWRRMNVLYEMYECTRKYQNKHKSGMMPQTGELKFFFLSRSVGQKNYLTFSSGHLMVLLQ